jgi:competence protein ComQ
MMEKETVKMKMREIVETSFSISSLKESVLTSIEDQAKRSDFLFGRLAAAHYQMFFENIKETERIAAAVELMMLAGDLLDDLVDQDSLETSRSKVPLTTSLHIVIGLLLVGQKAIADLPIDDIVLNDGKIVESGTHYELMKKKGFYYNLYYSKSNNEELDAVLEGEI